MYLTAHLRYTPILPHNYIIYPFSPTVPRLNTAHTAPYNHYTLPHTRLSAAHTRHSVPGPQNPRNPPSATEH